MDAYNVLTNKPRRRFSKGVYQQNQQPVTTASIPSKYQTVVIRNTDKKGFNVQSKRFNYESALSDNPGPGRYKTKDVQCCSYSTRGTGSFASKSHRSIKMSTKEGPNPATYNLPSLLSSRKDFNRKLITSSFKSPYANEENFSKNTSIAPAPNTYFAASTENDSKEVKIKRKRYVIGRQKAFLSSAVRDGDYIQNQKNPSPCHYNIHEGVTRKQAPAATSVFASGTQRGSHVRFADVPGPGSYKPHDPVTPPPNKLTMPRKHYLCISAPALQMPTPKQQPGPGTYELVDYEGPEKRYMSSGVFVSNTSRWTNLSVNKDNPAPTAYKPTAVGKQSFMFNVHNRWIPA